MDSRRDHAFDPFNPSPEHQRILDSLSGLNLGNVDFNDPASFASLLGSGMPAPPTMEPAELQQRAQAMAKDIFNDYELLGNICKSTCAYPILEARSWLTPLATLEQ